MELTSKQRAQLRGLANTIDTIIHIGKDGIGENLVKQADDALEARELIKGRVLENNIEYDARRRGGGAGKGHPQRGGAGDRHQVRAVPGEPQQAQREAYPAGEAVKKAAGVSGIALKQEMEFS